MALRGKFWSFSDDGTEFSFTKRDLRYPWRNFLHTNRLKCQLSHTGAGGAFDRSPHNDRLLPESNPRLVFVRDQADGAVWTLNGVDTPAAPADWQCTHGFGYTRLQSTRQDIAGSVTYFVPMDEPTEIWQIRLENRSRQARRLRVFPLVLWRFGKADYESGFDYVYYQDQMLIGECHHWPLIDFRSTHDKYNRNWDRVGFMASSPAPTGYDGVCAEFIGDGVAPLRAVAVQQGACRNSSQKGVDSCGALQLDVDLTPGASADLVVLVGMAADVADATRLRAQYGSPAQAAQAFADLRQWWTAYRDRMRVETPDADLTTYTNGWHRCNLFYRYFGRFGVRDTAQDMAAFAAFDYERVRDRLQLLYESQFADGNTRHDIDILGAIHHRTINSDLPLWLPWLTGRYVRETGDFALLDRAYDYADGGRATAYEHCRQAVDYLRRESGRFGLPLLKCGDWNDCLNGAAKAGVSVWLACLYHAALMEMHELASRTNRTADAARFLAQARDLAAAINQHAWDGRWYLMAFDDDGLPIGSHTEKEGRIWANPQTWAVLTGVASDERARTCLAAVEELMDTPVGIPLMAPPYTKTQARVGMITRYAAGHHHNGSSWHHAVTWAILAECKIGRADRALTLYRRLLPAYLSQNFPRHLMEPYVFASYTDTPQSGALGNTGIAWSTGTTGWMYRAMFEGFAGLTPEFDGLRVDPALPTEWRRLAVTRPYRGNTYHLTIEAPAGVTRGVKELYVNGQQIAGNLIPSLPPGSPPATVRVVLGAS